MCKVKVCSSFKTVGLLTIQKFVQEFNKKNLDLRKFTLIRNFLLDQILFDVLC